MANLTHFVNSATRSGSSVDFYLNTTPKIGSGKVDIIEPLKLQTSGTAKVFGSTIDMNIVVIMHSENETGTCDITFNGSTYTKQYRTSKKSGKPELVIEDVEGHDVYIYSGRRKWTWVKYTKYPAWIGIWPTSPGQGPVFEEHI